MKTSRIVFNFMASLSLLACSAHMLADEVSETKEQKVLSWITHTADKICTRAPEGGSTQETSLSGTVKLELSRLMKLITTDVDLNAKYSNASYQGVLQSQVLDAARESNQCKTHVFDVLVNNLLKPRQDSHAPQKTVKGKAAANTVTTYGANSPAIGNMTGGTVTINGK